jgi:predicted acylesterase/phospholipase RssA
MAPGEEYIAIVASSSIPGAFTPVFYEGHVYVDGGVYSNVGLENVINRCKETSSEDNIIIDVIMC